MTRALTPRMGIGHDAGLPLAVLAACWLPLAGAGLMWTAGNLAAWLSGSSSDRPPFAVSSARRFFSGGVGALWPGVPVFYVWGVAVLLLVLVVAPVGAIAFLTARSRARPGDPWANLATVKEVAGLAPAGVARRAEQLRSGLPASTRRERRDPAQDGVLLGRLSSRRGTGMPLRASWEDVVLAIMAPRAGKTMALAVPAVLDAPGPVVATSNKPDLWEVASAARGRQTGQRVWVFDPQSITGVPQSWWWNPLAGVRSVEDAHRLAGHFVQEVRGDRGDRDFWTAAALDLLTGLLLAAALDNRRLDDVYEWLNDPVLMTPVAVLRQHGHRAAAASLAGRQNGAPETRDGVYETARTAAQCLCDGAIMAWVSPAVEDALDRFDAAAFVHTRQTLFLLSKDGAGAAAPLVAALADRVMREATRAAERAGGRLDPPMVVVLDEAANVCRIGDLPELYSHLGSRGVLPVTVLQSYRQGTRVWGEHGMDALWSASTCKVLGAGLDDARLVEDVSRLVGEHDVPLRSLSRGSGQVSETVSLRRQRILPPEDIRSMPRGTALLLATGCRPALVHLQAWYDGPRAAEISAAMGARHQRPGE
jgi:type IV secretory pathway TraG/TraD family ATPase VirD4